MKKEYESPLFELQRFNFKEIMTGAKTPLTSSCGETPDYQIDNGDDTGADWW